MGVNVVAGVLSLLLGLTALIWLLVIHAMDIEVCDEGLDLEAYIACHMESAHIPSLSIAVVHQSDVMWQQAYGFADPFSDPPR